MAVMIAQQAGRVNRRACLSGGPKPVSFSLFIWTLGKVLFFLFVSHCLVNLESSPLHTRSIIPQYAAVTAEAMLPSGLAANRWGTYWVAFVA